METIECPSCIISLPPTSNFCNLCGIKLTTEILHKNNTKLNTELYAINLWNKYDMVSEKCRYSKQTAKYIGTIMEERAELEEYYGKTLIKIINKYNINLHEGESSSLGKSWNSIKLLWMNESNAHIEYSKSLILQTADPLNNIRLKLKAVKESSDIEIEKVNELRLNASESLIDMTKLLEASQQRYAKALSLNDHKSELYRKEVDELQLQYEMCQIEQYKTLNNYYQVLSKQLGNFGEFEVTRINDTSEILVGLLNHHWKLINSISVCKRDVVTVNAADDARAFSITNSSKEKCPWQAEVNNKKQIEYKEEPIAKRKSIESSKIEINGRNSKSKNRKLFNSPEDTNEPLGLLTLFQNLQFNIPSKSFEFSSSWHPYEFSSVIVPIAKAVVLKKKAVVKKSSPSKNAIHNLNSTAPIVKILNSVPMSSNPFDDNFISQPQILSYNPFDDDESGLEPTNPFDKHAIGTNKIQCSNPFEDDLPEEVFKTALPYSSKVIDSINPFDEAKILEESLNMEIEAKNKEFEFEIILKELPENFFNSSLTDVTIYQKKLVALEMFLLYSNMLKDLPCDSRVDLEISLRLSLSLSREKFESIVNKLTLDVKKETIATIEAKRSLNYRFDIMQQRITQLQSLSNVDIIEEILWFYRQINVIITCLFWHISKVQQFVIDNEPLSRSKVFLKIISKADEILRMIWSKLNNKDSLDFAIFDSLKLILKNILYELKLNEKGIYPNEFVNSSYFNLVSLLSTSETFNIENIDLNSKFDEFAPGVTPSPSLVSDWKKCLEIFNLYFSSVNSVKLVKEYSLISLGLNTISNISTYESVSIPRCMEKEIEDVNESIDIILTNVKELKESLQSIDIDASHKIWFGIIANGASLLFSNMDDIYNENEICVYNIFIIFKDLLTVADLISSKLNLFHPFKDFKKFNLESTLLNEVICVHCVYISSIKHYSRIKKNFVKSADPEVITDVKGFTSIIIEAIHTDAELYCPLLNKLSTSFKFSAQQIFLATFISSYLDDILDLNIAPERFLIDRVPSLKLLYKCVEDATSSYLDLVLFLKKILPDLTIICDNMLRSWVDYNSAQSMSWLGRCIEKDSWRKMDNCYYSTSVVDFFVFMSSLIESFNLLVFSADPFLFTHSTYKYLSNLLSDLVNRYCQEIVRSSFLNHLDLPLDCPRIEDDVLNRFKASIFSTDNVVNLPVHSNLIEKLSVSSLSSLDPVCNFKPDGLLVSLSVYCVKLSCLIHTEEMMDETIQILVSKWKGKVQHEDSNISEIFSSCTGVQCSFNANIFDECLVQVDLSIKEYVEITARRIVLGEWRKLLAHEIYNPTPKVNSFSNNDSNLKVMDETFELMYLKLGDSTFPILVTQIWQELTSTLLWTLQYGFGARVFSTDDCEIIYKDLNLLMQFFAKEIEKDLIMEPIKPINEFIELMKYSSEELIEFHQKNDSKINLAFIYRLLWCRSDKKAKKFIKHYNSVGDKDVSKEIKNLFKSLF